MKYKTTYSDKKAEMIINYVSNKPCLITIYSFVNHNARSFHLKNYTTPEDMLLEAIKHYAEVTYNKDDFDLDFSDFWSKEITPFAEEIFSDLFNVSFVTYINS